MIRRPYDLYMDFLRFWTNVIEGVSDGQTFQALTAGRQLRLPSFDKGENFLRIGGAAGQRREHFPIGIENCVVRNGNCLEFLVFELLVLFRRLVGGVRVQIEKDKI